MGNSDLIPLLPRLLLLDLSSPLHLLRSSPSRHRNDTGITIHIYVLYCILCHVCLFRCIHVTFAM